MKRILLTGMSGVGKSTIVRELLARGIKAIDTDYDGWSHWIDMQTGLPAHPSEVDDFPWERYDWVWNEQRMATLLERHNAGVLVVAGTSFNQRRFYPYFDHIVLLSAPTDVIMERLATRTNNPYGTTPRSREKVLDEIETIEPLLRAGASHEIDTCRPLDEVLEQILRIVES